DKLPSGSLPANVKWVQPDLEHQPGLTIIRAGLSSAQIAWQHDSQKLARIVMELLP
ncbi:MAG TPA: hypothetical protein G4N98_04945, partial [Thermoflexia bacterium]|nr:hypothetical protein [Thermoflexia bacterium]